MSPTLVGAPAAPSPTGRVQLGRFQFQVSGPRVTGVLYVTLQRQPAESDGEMRFRAMRRAAGRSGDACPVLVRDNLDRREVF